MTAAIAVLLVVATAGELFGTLTVWQTYRRGSRVAEEFRDELRREQHELAGMGDAKQLLNTMEDIGTGFRVTALEGQFRDARSRVSTQLGRDGVTTAGLCAFVLGALAGLAAGLVALYR